MTEFVRPEKILEAIDIRPDFIIADFGAGSGFYTLAAARKLSGSGTVYAIDIRKESLETIRGAATLEHLFNIETLWADLETPGSLPLKEGLCDVVIISNILFQAENKEDIVREAHRILKSGGKSIIIEWKKQEKSDGGPPAASRVLKEETEKVFLGVGFKKEKEVDAGSHHYGLVFRK